MTGLLAMPTIVRGDARHLPLADGSVDLIVTSPPYWGLRAYQDGGEAYAGQIGAEDTPGEYLDALIDCTREWMRVLKPTGSIWVDLGDKYGGQGVTGQRAARTQAATYSYRPTSMRPKSLLLLPERYRIRCVDDLGLIARAVVIWSKPNAMPESATDRMRRSHEDWVHLTLQPRYYADIDQVRERYSPNKPWGSRGVDRYSTGSGRRDTWTVTTPTGWTSRDENPLGKLPGSVCEIATQPLTVPAALGVDHYASYPMEWPRRLIKGWCPPAGVVLDPFGGTGTTVLVATMLGRTGITVDASGDYCRIAAWRCADPRERAKAAQVAQPPPISPGQADLFGAAS